MAPTRYSPPLQLVHKIWSVGDNRFVFITENVNEKTKVLGNAFMQLTAPAAKM